MDCRECSRLVDAYLDNAIPAETRQEMENHLTACAACGAELREAKEAAALYRSLIAAQRPGPDFAGRVMARLASRQPAAAFPVALLVLGLVLAFLAAGLFSLMPFAYPVLCAFGALLFHLLAGLAVMLAAFPAIEALSIAFLAAALILVAWGARRAMLY